MMGVGRKEHSQDYVKCCAVVAISGKYMEQIIHLILLLFIVRELKR